MKLKSIIRLSIALLLFAGFVLLLPFYFWIETKVSELDVYFWILIYMIFVLLIPGIVNYKLSKQ